MRHLTAGRVFVLLLVGLVVGAAIFLRTRLGDDALEEQLVALLDEVIATPFEVDRVEFGLESGIRITGLRIDYPDGARAIDADLTLTLDLPAVVRGGASAVRQIEISRLYLRLRRDPAADSLPSLPGVFRPRADTAPVEGLPAPIRIARGAVLDVDPEGYVAGDAPLRFVCEWASLQPHGTVVEGTIALTAGRAQQIMVTGTADVAGGLARARIDLSVKAQGLRWERGDLAALAPPLRPAFGWTQGDLPHYEFAGAADLALEIRRGDGLDLDGTVSLHDLTGAFGNLFTQQRLDLPFGFERGSCTARVVARALDAPTPRTFRLSIEDFRADFVTRRSGRGGHIAVDVELDLARPVPELDVSLEGRGIRATTEELTHLLPVDVARNVIAPYRPSGLFDMDVHVAQRFGLPERVTAEVTLHSGEFLFVGSRDEQDAQRDGFPYPMYDCRGRFRVETGISTPRGRGDLVEILGVEGRHAIRSPRPGEPKFVTAKVHGHALFFPKSADGDAEVDLHLLARDMPIDEDLEAAWEGTPKGEAPYSHFQVQGWAGTVEVALRQRAGIDRGLWTEYDIQLRDCSIVHRDFPVPIDGITGRLHVVDSPVDDEGKSFSRLWFDDLAGRVRDGGTLTAAASVLTIGGVDVERDVTIDCKDLALGEALGRALVRTCGPDSGAATFWDEVRPAGAVDAKVRIGPEHWEFSAELGGHVSLRGVAAGPVESLAGVIRYDQGAGTFVFDGVSGRIADSPFHIERGQLHEDGRIDVAGAITPLRLVPSIREALVQALPDFGPVIEPLRLRPGSEIDVAVALHRDQPGGPLAVSGRIDALRLATAPRGLPLTIRGGPVVFDGDGVTAREVEIVAEGGATLRVHEAEWPFLGTRPARARVGATGVEPRAHVDRLLAAGFADLLGETGRIDLADDFVIELVPGRMLRLQGTAQLHRVVTPGSREEALQPTGRLRFDPLVLDLPAHARDALRFQGAVDVAGLNLNLELAARDLSGRLDVARGKLEGGAVTFAGHWSEGSVTVLDRRLEHVALELEIGPEFVALRGIKAKVANGDLAGDVQLHLEEPRGFQIALMLQGADLGELVKEDLPREGFEGTIDAALALASPSGTPSDWRGSGKVRVRDADLFKLKGARRVLGVLSRVTPLSLDDRFQRAEVDVEFKGETIVVERYQLATALNDVLGRGTISRFGDLNLLVEPQVTRLLDLPRLVNVPVLSKLRDLWHKTVYEIRIEGSIDAPEIGLRAVPFLRGDYEPEPRSPYAGEVRRRRPRVLPDAVAPEGIRAPLTTRRETPDPQAER